jgi:PDZ domain-containing protein
MEPEASPPPSEPGATAAPAGGRSPARLALLIAIGVCLVIAGSAFVLGKQADEFVLLPDHPHAADAIVSVKGEDPRPTNDGPGIYYLDVLVHRATLGETWLAPLERGAERIPAKFILPPAGSQRDLNRIDKLDVQSSKRLAALVAFRALGRKVTVTGGGVRIDQVDPSAPAHAAGLAPGMVVIRVDGTPVRSLTALRNVLANRKPGDAVSIDVLDGSRRRTISTLLTKSSSAPGRALLGIAGQDVAPNVKLPVPVKIDTGNLGGPSAGLAFALEIYDSLTGRKLSRGRKIAVTGTIDQDGKVGLVGGIKGKTLGAREAGFDLMLVPRSEAGTARKYSGSQLRVIGVRTFADALRELRK